MVFALPEPSAVAPSPKPPEGALARAFAGTRPDGCFWIPKTGDFPAEDVLVTPDGEFVEHLQQHPGSVGRWSIAGDVLTFDGTGGTYAIKSLHIRGNELRGITELGPIVMRRTNP